jgi:glycosyltransferase involved in cell wall biosynthesis
VNPQSDAVFTSSVNFPCDWARFQQLPSLSCKDKSEDIGCNAEPSGGNSTLDLLLEALTDERVKALNVKLIVAGEYYEDAAPYNTFIEQHKLQERLVMHTHFIADDDVRWYFSACDLVAQTYHTATQSGVTKIALQFNRPSLVTDVGGLGEIIVHGTSGYVVAPQAKVIADSIVDYYTDKREAAFTAATIEEKKKYSWEVMCNAVTLLHQKITGTAS